MAVLVKLGDLQQNTGNRADTGFNLTVSEYEGNYEAVRTRTFPMAEASSELSLHRLS